MAKYVKTEEGYKLIEDVISSSGITAKYVKTETGFVLIDDIKSSSAKYVKTEEGYSLLEDTFTSIEGLTVIAIKPTWKTTTTDYSNNSKVHIKSYNDGGIKVITESDFLNYDSSAMTLSGDIEAEGSKYADTTHKVYITPKKGYCWSDGSASAITLTWVIVNIDWLEGKGTYTIADRDKDTTIEVYSDIYVSPFLLQYISYGGSDFVDASWYELGGSVEGRIKDGFIYITIDENNSLTTSAGFGLNFNVDSIFYKQLTVDIEFAEISIISNITCPSSLDFNSSGYINLQLSPDYVAEKGSDYDFMSHMSVIASSEYLEIQDMYPNSPGNISIQFYNTNAYDETINASINIAYDDGDYSYTKTFNIDLYPENYNGGSSGDATGVISDFYVIYNGTEYGSLTDGGIIDIVLDQNHANSSFTFNIGAGGGLNVNDYEWNIRMQDYANENGYTFTPTVSGYVSEICVNTGYVPATWGSTWIMIEIINKTLNTSSYVQFNYHV